MDDPDSPDGDKSGPPNPDARAGAPPALTRAAIGEDVSGQDEFDVLEWVLGGDAAPEDDVTVFLDTPKGPKPLEFHIVGVDGDEIAKAEREHYTGHALFGEPEISTAGHAAVAALGITTMTNPAKGKTVEIRSPEFLGDVPDPAIAMLNKYRKFPGILEGLARTVRDISGYGLTSIQRGKVSKIEDAAGNS